MANRIYLVSTDDETKNTVSEIITDTYDSTSDKAMSGKAVVSALKQVPISSETGNTLSQKDDGLYVPTPDVVEYSFDEETGTLTIITKA